MDAFLVPGKFFSFPRAGVGTHSRSKNVAGPQRRDAGANQIGSHAGAWEPEKRL